MKTPKRRVAEKISAILELRLYIANSTARSVLARGNLQRLCEQFIPGEYRVTIIDLAKQSELARKHEITAIPTLVRVSPGPQRTVIGSLADTARVLRALEVNDQPEKLASLLSRAGAQIGAA